MTGDGTFWLSVILKGKTMSKAVVFYNHVTLLKIVFYQGQVYNMYF